MWYNIGAAVSLRVPKKKTLPKVSAWLVPLPFTATLPSMTARKTLLKWGTRRWVLSHTSFRTSLRCYRKLNCLLEVFWAQSFPLNNHVYHCLAPEIPSLSFSVLCEGHVWSADAGRSRRPVGVRSVRGEARGVALQLHSVHQLHGGVAGVKNTLVFTWSSTMSHTCEKRCRNCRPLGQRSPTVSRPV